LTNGQVLVAGGHNCQLDPSAASQSAERFDPASGTFAGTGDMEVGHSVGSRIGHTATTLANGQVLLYGGNPNRSEAEIYQPGVTNPPGLQ
jgi:hypothetical protein